MQTLRSLTALGLASALLFGGCGDDDVPPPDAGGGDAGVDGGGGMTCGLTATTLAGQTTQPGGADGAGGNGDLVVQNDVMRVVFAAVDRPAQIAASGGTIIDMHLLGQGDQMNELSQIGGPAQSLQVRYTAMRVAEMDGAHAVVEATGHVQPLPPAEGEMPIIRPEPGTSLAVTTRYTIRCDEPVVHLESTISNTGSVALDGDNPFAIMDIMLWGGRGLVPFCPVAGQGDQCNPFDITNPLEGLVEALYVGSAGSTGGAEGTFALYTEDLDQDEMLSVHSETVSSIGYFMIGSNTLSPGTTYTFRRGLVVGGRADAASAVDLALEALAAQGRFELSTVTGTVTPPTGESISMDPYARPMVVLAQPGTGTMPLDPERWKPLTMARVDATGRFTARVPAGAVAWELRAPGRQPRRAMGGMAAAGSTLDLGALALDPAPVLDVTVEARRDGTTGPLMPARVVLKGTGTTPDPVLGSATGGSPAGNVALTDGMGMISLRVPEGTYDVYATRGLEWTIARQSVTVGAAGASVTLQLQPLDLMPDANFFTADFHVHSAASFDSSLPDTDRVMAYVAEGVDAIVATEHDVVFDYAPALATVEAGLDPMLRGSALRTFVGLESTTSVPQTEFVHSIGHYNAFPLTEMLGASKNGAPTDEYLNPGQLYETLRALASPATPLVQLNHPRSSRYGRLWIGYFDGCGYDPTMPAVATGPCFRGTGAMGTRAWDADTMEVLNGKNAPQFVQVNRDWLSLLLQAPGGRIPVGTANSDSHELVVEHAGYPVTVLRRTGGVASLDDAALVSTVQSGAAAGAVGVVTWAWAHAPTAGDFTGTEPGRTVAPAPGGNLVLDVHVAAAPWVPVDEIRIRVNGNVVHRIPASMLTTPTDPFGTTGVVRYHARAFDLSTLGLTADAFVTVEAGFALPRVGDLDGDGVVDTTDNDGDGDVDATDMTMGGFRLAAPTGPFTVIAPNAHAMSFTNPIFLDVNGNGMYDPPGTPLVD